MVRKKTTEEFIKEAREIHGDKYDYSLVKYEHNKCDIQILCPIHGIFYQRPFNHIISKQGCIKCKKQKPRKTTEQFIIEAREIHGDKYDYSKVEYILALNKVNIICSIHGIFKQKPSEHLQGYGCSLCAGNIKKIHDIFVQQVNEAYNGTYEVIGEYLDAHTKIKFRCVEHDQEYEQTPNDFLRKRIGCLKCQPVGWSRAAQEWIEGIESAEGIHIQHAPREQEKVIEGYKVDGWCEETKTIYEFHGDYWHGNRKVYQLRMDEVNKSNGKTFGQLYKETCKKTQSLRALGYRVIEKWET